MQGRGLCFVVMVFQFTVLAPAKEREARKLQRFEDVQDYRVKKQYFPLFADGQVASPESLNQVISSPGTYTSRLILTNPSETTAVHGLIEVWATDGSHLDVRLNDESTIGGLAVEVPPAGTVVLSSRGQGRLKTGSLVVYSDCALSAAIVIDGPTASVGLGPSAGLKYFVASLEFRSTTDLQRNAVAVMNLEDEPIPVMFELYGPDGISLALAEVILPPFGHFLRFVGQLPWMTTSAVVPVGASIRGSTTFAGKLAIVSIGVTPTEIWSLPVTRAKP